MYDHHPKQRRLDNDAKIIATKMVKMKVNKTILQNDLGWGHTSVQNASIRTYFLTRVVGLHYRL